MNDLEKLIAQVEAGDMAQGAILRDAMNGYEQARLVRKAFDGSVDAAISLNDDLLGDRWDVFLRGRYTAYGERVVRMWNAQLKGDLIGVLAPREYKDGFDAGREMGARDIRAMKGE